MDDTTRKLLVTLAAGAAKKGLITLGSIGATHGLLEANQTEMFVTGGMAVVGLVWSFWNDTGKAVVLAQLEIYKAKVLAQAAKLKENSIAPVTVSQIAAQSATLTTADVAKGVAAMPAEIQANVKPG